MLVLLVTCKVKNKNHQFINSKIDLKNGARFIIDDKHPFDKGTEEIVGTTYKNLSKELNINDILLLDDGRIELKVEKISDSKLFLKLSMEAFYMTLKA